MVEPLARTKPVRDSRQPSQCLTVTEIYETAQVTGNSGQKGVGTVTMTLVNTSETVTTVQFAIDVTGSEPDEARVMLDVAIQSYGSGTLPTVAAA